MGGDEWWIVFGVIIIVGALGVVLRIVIILEFFEGLFSILSKGVIVYEIFWCFVNVLLFRVDVVFFSVFLFIVYV